MLNQRVSAFTCKANGKSNVLKSEVTVSANKELFPNAESKKFNAIWDTGATNTAISNRVAKECGLIPTGQAICNAANGQSIVNTYLIDIGLPNNVNISKIPATEFKAVEGSDLLIGMDIMSLGDLAISNYEGKTTFTFRLPSMKCTDYVREINQIKFKNVGRNDPCPCGSTKKFKNCCIDKLKD